MKILEILDELGIPYAEHGESTHVTANWIGVDCPYCSPGSGKFKMGIPINGFVANCWTCGRKSLKETLVEASGKTWKEVSALLDQMEKSPPFKEKVRGTLRIPKGVTTMGPAHRSYLHRRGLDSEEIERLWDVKGIGLAAKFAWTLFIPIHLRGEMVSWTTRAIGNKGIRYMTAPPNEEKMHHKDVLYGEDYARHSIIICEGPIDVWTFGPGAVCTFGVNYSDAQFEKMAKYPVRAVCFDNEPEAQRQASGLADRLSVYPGRTFNIVLASGKDANSANPREIQRLRRKFLT